MTNKPQFVGEKIAFSDAFVEVSRGVKKIKQKDYLPAGDHPIIDQGQDAVSGYACGEEGLFSDVPAIVFGDHTRCVKYVSEPFFAGADGVKILRPKQSDNVRFWWHALRTTRIENLGYSRHFKLLKESRFANYDEQNQRVICENLDRIMDEIDRANRQLAALDSLVKSRFVEMFGDPVSNPKKLRTRPGSALFKIGNGKTKPMSERRETGYPAYGGNGVSWYSQQSLTYSPTIIIGRVGRHCGNTRLVNKPCWITDNAMYIKQFRDNELNLIYLDELMQIVDFNRYADKGDLWKITQQPFMEFNYPLPPLPLQQEFADFVAQVDKSRFIAQQQIEKLQMLYDSLAQEYFE